MPTSATHIQSTTQEFIDIYDITNDIMIMKDGACSLLLTVDALNFGLLAEEEQDAIMYSYAGLLNSLNYPIQIVIRSQTKDATNYLNLLKEQEMRASSDLKKSQIRAYAGFVADLIRERNVLDKKFYIVIPASALEMGLLPPATVVPGVKQIDISTVERSVILDKAKTILEPKRDHLVSQFSRIGLFARQLNTQEIIQLFYTSYNPEAAEGQQITNTNDYTTPLVTGQTTLTQITTPLPAPAQAPLVQPTQPSAEIAIPQPEITNTPVYSQTLAPEQVTPPTLDMGTVGSIQPDMSQPTYQPSFESPQPFITPAVEVGVPTDQSAQIDQTIYQAQGPVNGDVLASTTAYSETPVDQISPDPAVELQQVINATAQDIQAQPVVPVTTINPSPTTPNPLLTPTQPSNLPPLPEI